MTNSQTNSNQIDRLSNLSDELLLKILSLFPTRIAARTSILSRRFRHLWEASPFLALISRDLPHPQRENFAAMAKRAILCRNPCHPLLSLHLDVSRCQENASFISSLLFKVRSLDLRHLTIEGCWFENFLLIIPMIFTINTLRCLSFDCDLNHAICFPSGSTLTRLRSLSIRLFNTDTSKLNQLLSELCSLEDLQLYIRTARWLSLSSQIIRKLKLIFDFGCQKPNKLEFYLPKLESLHLEIKDSLKNLSHIHGYVPLLRKAVVNLYELRERNASYVAGLLNCISHVEELILHLKENDDVKYPIPILLESGKYMPNFSNLKHLEVTLCFHEHNLEAVTTMLRNCPVLRSLKLVHEIPKFTDAARVRKREDWESKLPLNADGDYHYANFRNLHLGKDIKIETKSCDELTGAA